MSVAITAFIKFLTPAAKAAATKGTNLKRKETIALSKAVNKASEALKVPRKEAKIKLKAAAKLPPPSKKTQSEKAAGAGKYKPKKPNPKLISDPGNVAPKDRKKVARLKASQDLDDAGKPLKSGKEMMTKEQRLNSNQLELDAGVGSGSDVVSRIKDGSAITRDQAKEFDEIAAKESSGFQVKKRGGTVKRNIGGAVRGVGAATRGFGKANYSNKLY